MQAVSHIRHRMKALVSSLQAPALGIDIGSDSVKVVALKQIEDSIHVLATGYANLPEGAVLEHKIKDPHKVAITIRSLLHKCGIKANSAIVALPNSEVCSKLILLDKEFCSADHQSIEQQLLNEMASQVNYASEFMRLDYQFISPLQNNDDYLPVLAIAAHQDVVVNYQTVLAQAGLDPLYLDAEQFVIARMYPWLDLSELGNKPNLCLAVLDFGSQYASLTVIEGEKVLYMQEHKIRLNGQEPLQFMQQWAERALTLFYTSGNHSEVNGIVLAGSHLANHQDLALHLKLSLKLPVLSANPFAHIQVSKPIVGNPHAYLLSCGLAMRGLS